ncbi:hypothetical protein A8C56_01515 [Niabella ginsenosidivorans]|uniref:Xylose isomerase-like TIM barrel domain-containing protein n=1 Tax=Niabella ginsenosidivorans TaxID=1176587 RepID=A0A1A9HWR3_9BACT|nr:TIM barrel protein [Niabella ginsenosidivorans]ANH79826.1 hypothetical protein A8C56_01515 [Niabella ginsenosidivorans]
MERRNFIKKAAAAGGTAMLGLGATSRAASFMKEMTGDKKSISNRAKFRLKYAPGLTLFSAYAGKDPVDNMKFIADQGFRAVFELGMVNLPAATQEKIANAAARLGLEMAEFSLKIDFSGSTFVLQDPEIKEMLRKKVMAGIEVQKRTGINKALVVLGRYDQKLHWDYQTANVIDNLRMCCELAEKPGLTFVIEPLNHTNHPGLFLTRLPQAKMICIAVGHPNCRIVDDMYHQQITEGNIIPHMDNCWDYIGSFHIGDNPGRNEPASGEMNYRNIFRHIYEKGYKGTLCCEHGKSKPGKEGALAVIQAYREADSF